MNEKDFKELVREKYDDDHSIRTNWEDIVLDGIEEDEDVADTLYGDWFDEVYEEMEFGLR